MDFSTILSNIAFCNNSKRKINEEETKMYLIYPFLEYLGYSVFSPNDIAFEYVCDMHENGNRRVDCAVLDKGSPIIILEAKPHNELLSAHWGQIKSYFISSGSRFAILTNGISYHVFENDQIDKNFSACVPKYIFDLDKLTEDDYEIINQLSKISLKPFVVSEDSVLDNKDFSIISEEEKAVIAFCNITQKSSIINTPTADVYNNFIQFCSQKNLPFCSKIAFSKRVNKYFSTCVISKRTGKSVQRVFVSS